MNILNSVTTKSPKHSQFTRFVDNNDAASGSARFQQTRHAQLLSPLPRGCLPLWPGQGEGKGRTITCFDLALGEVLHHTIFQLPTLLLRRLIQSARRASALSFIALCLCASVVTSPAYTITNINIGMDSNSLAWTKVNNNNNNFVSWLNSMTLSNSYVLLVVSNNSILVSNVMSSIPPSLNSVSNRLNLVSSNFTVVSNLVSHSVSTNMFASGGNVGIGNASPACTLDVAGPIRFTGGPSSNNVSMLLGNDGVGAINWTIYDGTNAQPVQFSLAGSGGFFRSTGGGAVYFDGTQSKIGIDSSAQVFLCNSNGGMDIIDASGNGAHLDGSGHFVLDQSFSSDAGNFYSDGSGNVTCVNLTQTSDVNTKTNIVPLDPADVLQKLLAIPVFHWNFRDFTTTNFVGDDVRSRGIGANTNNPAIITQHHLSSIPHFGPMAQDWSASFGGRTNGISVIDMQGLLLAGLQALAGQANTFTNANGAKFHLIVNSTTNGFVFVPQ